VSHPRRTAIAYALIALALTTSCSSPAERRTPASGSTTGQSAVAYSACMRAHGVPGFPDPAADGVVPKADARQLGVSTTQLQSAQQACQATYPVSASLSTSLRQCEETGDCPQPIVAQVMDQLQKFAVCMRAHGVPHWPDAVIDAQGRPEIYIKPWVVGFDPDSPRIQSIMTQCRSSMDPPVPPPLAVYLPPSAGTT
jgi:hypothetical protein